MGGPLFVDLDGFEISSEEKELVSHPFIGGIILFSRNFENCDQLRDLVRQIHAVRSPPLLIGVDQEGGSVQRFKEGFSKLPSLSLIGDQYEKNPEWSKSLARDHAWVMASELLDVGIDFSFSPVVDLKDPRSSVIGNRAFHSHPEVVSVLASVYVETLKSRGMSAVAKHFPGHGLVVEDSHFDLPVDDRPLTKIMSNDILPYRRIVNAGLAGIMMAHVLYSEVDDKVAGYSDIWMGRILREEMGFDGVIFSDDLNMVGAAASDSYVERGSMALEAGCDSLLLCNNRFGVEEVLDSQILRTSETLGGNRLEKMRSKQSSRETLSLSRDSNWVRAKANLKAISGT